RTSASTREALRCGRPRKQLAAARRRRQYQAWTATAGGDHLAGARGRHPGDHPHRTAGQAASNPGLRSDEDVEPLEEIRLEPLPRAVGDLETGEVRRAIAKALQDDNRHRVPDARSELVDVERKRFARLRRS